MSVKKYELLQPMEFSQIRNERLHQQESQLAVLRFEEAELEELVKTLLNDNSEQAQALREKAEGALSETKLGILQIEARLRAARSFKDPTFVSQSTGAEPPAVS